MVGRAAVHGDGHGDVLVLVPERDAPLGEIVGLVEAEGRDGVTELIAVLSEQACLLGADAVIDIKEAVGSGYSAVGMVNASGGNASASTYTIYHLTATAVRYTP